MASVWLSVVLEPSSLCMHQHKGCPWASLFSYNQAGLGLLTSYAFTFHLQLSLDRKMEHLPSFWFLLQPISTPGGWWGCRHRQRMCDVASCHVMQTRIACSRSLRVPAWILIFYKPLDCRILQRDASPPPWKGSREPCIELIGYKFECVFILIKIKWSIQLFQALLETHTHLYLASRGFSSLIRSAFLMLLLNWMSPGTWWDNEVVLIAYKRSARCFTYWAAPWHDPLLVIIY